MTAHLLGVLGATLFMASPLSFIKYVHCLFDPNIYIARQRGITGLRPSASPRDGNPLRRRSRVKRLVVDQVCLKCPVRNERPSSMRTGTFLANKENIYYSAQVPEGAFLINYHQGSREK
jgi:hypothetical protein